MNAAPREWVTVEAAHARIEVAAMLGKMLAEHLPGIEFNIGRESSEVLRVQARRRVISTAETFIRLTRDAYLEDGYHRVRVIELWQEQRVGTISWDIESGEVVELIVHQDYRRQGIATKLWVLAKKSGAVHSEWRTKEGQAWALSLGEQLPKWRLA